MKSHYRIWGCLAVIALGIAPVWAQGALIGRLASTAAHAWVEIPRDGPP